VAAARTMVASGRSSYSRRIGRYRGLTSGNSVIKQSDHFSTFSYVVSLLIDTMLGGNAPAAWGSQAQPKTEASSGATRGHLPHYRKHIHLLPNVRLNFQQEICVEYHCRCFRLSQNKWIGQARQTWFIPGFPRICASIPHCRVKYSFSSTAVPKFGVKA
jgi:hypothetical protein